MNANTKKVLSKRLVEIAEEVTVSDRQDAEIKIPISRPTLDKYLSGDIVKIDTATKLVQFFSEKIKARLELINATNIM